MLLGLLVVPLVFFLFGRIVQKNRERVEATFSSSMLSRLTVPRSVPLVVIKATALLISTLAFVLYFAQPQSSKIESRRESSYGRDIFVLLDASESMNAEDVEPNRLSSAILDVEDLLDASYGDRFGLIAFAGTAQVEIPLTTDREFFRELLRKIDSSTIEMGGTALGDAIRLALQRFGNDEERERVIVIITDGEDHDSMPLEAAQRAKDANVPIFSFAIGDPRGAKIPIYNASGIKSYKTFDGESVVSKPDVETLKQIAQISGGRYHYANSTLNMAEVYKNEINALTRSALTRNQTIRRKDLYQPFLATGLFAFAIYYFVPSRTKRFRTKSTLRVFALAFFTLFISCPTIFGDTTKENESVDKSRSKPSAPFKNEKEEIRVFNEAVQKHIDGQIDDALALQESLQRAQSAQVASRANYNLGVASLIKAQKTLSELREESLSNPKVNTMEARNNSEGSQSQIFKEAVTEYNKQRYERELKRKETARLGLDSARHFYNGAGNKERANKETKNAELVDSWIQQMKTDEEARELQLRAQALPSPEPRLTWTLGNLNERIERLEVKNAPRATRASFQAMFEDAKTLGLLEEDVKSICEATTRELGTNDPTGIVKMERARKDFVEEEKAASKALSRYEIDASRQKLRGTRARLLIMRDVVSSYPEMVVTLAEREKQNASTGTIERYQSFQKSEIESFFWDKLSLLNSTEELERKARLIVDEPNAADREASERPDENITSGSKDDKIRESARIALSYQSELRELVSRMKNLLGSEREQLNQIDGQTATILSENQTEIARILEEIARPLQDEEQNNQTSSSSSNDQQNESNSKDASNKENDDSGNSNNQQDELPESLNEKQEDSQNKNPGLESEQSSKPELKDETPKDSSAPKRDKSQLSPEEKEAESLIRQMERRQKDAEEQRHLVREALKKREKSGKDW